MEHEISSMTSSLTSFAQKKETRRKNDFETLINIILNKGEIPHKKETRQVDQEQTIISLETCHFRSCCIGTSGMGFYTPFTEMV
jgi:hypothetical protein